MTDTVTFGELHFDPIALFQVFKATGHEAPGCRLRPSDGRKSGNRTWTSFHSTKSGLVNAGRSLSLRYPKLDPSCQVFFDPSSPVPSISGGPKVGPFQRVTRSRAGCRGGTAGSHPAISSLSSSMTPLVSLAIPL